MSAAKQTLRVYYDGACPICVRDRRRYEQMAGANADQVEWLDITGREAELKSQGIEPDAALKELHVKDEQDVIHRELDAYILLFSRITWLKPIAWLISLPVLKGMLSWGYRRWVKRRLIKDGRWRE